MIRHAELRPWIIMTVLNGLTDEQLRVRPHPAANSLAWLIWHMARGEDFAVNRLIAGRPQLFEDEDWATRLGVSLRRTGTGMTDAEVGHFSAHVDLAALKDYWAAVGRRTVVVAARSRPSPLAVTLTAEELRRQIADADALGGLSEETPSFSSSSISIPARRKSGRSTR